MTRYQLHVLKWKDCDLCFLSESRKRVVLSRGKIPCDILFIGEAPGKSEDVVGQPFIGPAGHLQDQMIHQALGHFTLCPDCELIQNRSDSGVSCRNGHGYGHEDTGREFRIAFTNLISCIPVDSDGSKAGEPDEVCIQACRDRLAEFVGIARPKLVITVGKLSREFLERGFRHTIKIPFDGKMVNVTHPAHILRANVAQKGMLQQKYVNTLKNAVKKEWGG